MISHQRVIDSGSWTNFSAHQNYPSCNPDSIFNVDRFYGTKIHMPVITTAGVLSEIDGSAIVLQWPAQKSQYYNGSIKSITTLGEQSRFSAI